MEVCRVAEEVRHVTDHPVEVCRAAAHLVEVCRLADRAAECEFAYTDLCSLRIQWRLEWESVARWLALQMGCNPVYLLWMIERLKWQESHANAADRGDRV